MEQNSGLLPACVVGIAPISNDNKTISSFFNSNVFVEKLRTVIKSFFNESYFGLLLEQPYPL